MAFQNRKYTSKYAYLHEYSLVIHLTHLDPHLQLFISLNVPLILKLFVNYQHYSLGSNIYGKSLVDMC